MRGYEESKLTCRRQGLRKRKVIKAFLDILIYTNNSKIRYPFLPLREI